MSYSVNTKSGRYFIYLTQAKQHPSSLMLYPENLQAVSCSNQQLRFHLVQTIQIPTTFDSICLLFVKFFVHCLGKVNPPKNLDNL